MSDQETKKQVPTRDQLRAKLFDSGVMEPKRIPVMFNGVELELKQPTVEQIMAFHGLAEDRSRIAHALINFICLPGSNEKLFEAADYDTIVAMPYTPELLAIQEALTSFLISDVKEEEKN